MVDVEHTLTSKAAPAPGFWDAMRAFVHLVMEIIEVPEAWEHGENCMSVTGISLSEDKDGRRGLVITARKPIVQANNAPLIMNTPYLKEPLEPKEENAVGFWPDGMKEALTDLQTAAQEFADGKRAQTELPLDGEPAADLETPPLEGADAKPFSETLKEGRAELPGVEARRRRRKGSDDDAT
jgi:hypothetical protein